MKITKAQLRQIIKEEKAKLLEYEQYVDDEGNIYDDEGNVTKAGSKFGKQYGGSTYGINPPWSSSKRFKRNVTQDIAPSNKSKIDAIELALSIKPSNFLDSILAQLKAGRGLSSKQNTVIRKILQKSKPESAKLFESHITRFQLRRIIREEKALLSEVMTEAATLSSGDYGMLTDAKRMLATVIANLKDYGGQSVYGEGDEEILDQLELLYDINNSLASVLGVSGGTSR